ncbi:MAG: MarR family transcriptional regulator [Bacilli bacterium]|nr:MarR family transcriptional regulator [Bacilli bacterium]
MKYIGYEIKDVDILLTRKIFSLYKENSNKIITPIQCKIIDYLLINEKVYQKDLEKEFNLRRSTISGILKTMEKNGFILKKQTNSRINLIVLTKDVKEEMSKIKEKMLNLEKELKKNISEKELEIFFDVIGKLKENIKGE